MGRLLELLHPAAPWELPVQIYCGWCLATRPEQEVGGGRAWKHQQHHHRGVQAGDVPAPEEDSGAPQDGQEDEEGAGRDQGVETVAWHPLVWGGSKPQAVSKSWRVKVHVVFMILK